MKSPIAEALNLRLHGVTDLERMIAMIISTMEMANRQRELGFAGCGCWHYRVEHPETKGKNWPEYVKDEYGREASTFYNYKKAASVVRERMRAWSLASREEALALMDAKPSTLTPEQLQDLFRYIGLALGEGDNLTTLLREYRSRQRKPHWQSAAAGTEALVACELHTTAQRGSPFPSGFSVEKFIEETRLVDDLPSGVFWLLVAAATCLAVEGREPSEIEIAVLAKAWMMGYSLRQGKVVGPAAAIAATAEERGASPEEGVAIAQMILLDECRGFPVPLKSPKPTAES